MGQGDRGILGRRLRVWGVNDQGHLRCGYRDFTGSSTVSNDVQALLGKMFFVPTVGDNSNKTVLYTPSSALRDVCGGAIDATKELGLVVPKNVEVRVSKLKIGEDEMYDKDMPDWAQFDMRRDILWCAHEGIHLHAKQATTVKRAMTLGWWPSLEVAPLIRVFHNSPTTHHNSPQLLWVSCG